MRVVLDTNVYISAILFGGNCEEILKLAGAGSFEIAISKHIISEIRGILKRKFKWTERQVKETVSYIKDITTEVKPGIKLSIVRKDPADNRILECAVAAEAACIVTGDSHLLDLKKHEKIRIFTPAEFLKL